MTGSTAFTGAVLRWTAGALVALAFVFAVVTDARALTFVLDFDSFNTSKTDDFDVTDFGFTAADRDDVTTAVLNSVASKFQQYPTMGDDAASPISDGNQLDIDFVIGAYNAPDPNTLPSNGDQDFFVVQIGSVAVGQSISYLGQAFGQARNQNGDPMTGWQGHTLASIYTDNIGGLTNFAGDMMKTVNAIAGTVAHEIGHTLNLGHAVGKQLNPGESLWSLMATGASPSNMPNAQRLLSRQFSYGEMTALTTMVDLRTAQEAAGAPADSVPEPAGILLFAVAVLGTVAARRHLA